MSHARSRSRSGDRFRFKSALIVGGLALACTAAPVTVTPDLASIEWQMALGKGNGGGNGGGSGNGGGGPGGGGPRGGAGGDGPGGSNRHGGGHAKGHGGNDNGHRGQGHAYGRSGGQGHGQPAEYGSLAEFKDAMQSGKAFGLERRDERIDQGKERYGAALSGSRRKGQEEGADFASGKVAHRFAPEDTNALIERGWKGPKARTDGFKNHGERVRTMVELAKRLGYGAHVGALQANFGTPQENGIRELEMQLAEARSSLQADPDDTELQARVAALEAELDSAITAAKPGNGPQDSWARADLDVNQDGVVDRRDLDALEQNAATPSGSEPAA